MSKKIFWLVGIVAVCIIGIIVLTDKNEESVAIDYENQPYVGEASAPVEIVEFGDYKCPSCKDFNDQLFPLIQEQFVKTGKAKFYFMNYSFIAPDSTTAAQFAETVYKELGNETFWAFHHLLFANQPTSEQAIVFTDEVLEKMLMEVASEEEASQVMAAHSDNKGKDAWEKDMKTAKNLGISSTPTIFIGGKEFKGRTMDDFAKMVEEAEKSAK
nr:thioredoxin domain-containing protein [Sporosarcina obsidiansis]